MFRKAVGMFALCGVMVVLIACAKKPPEATVTQALIPELTIASQDTITVKIEVASGVKMAEDEQIRLAKEIDDAIKSRMGLNVRQGDTREYEIDVTIQRYAKGSSVARLMLAGLGQIHIDGDVKLLQSPDRKQVKEFAVKKTFAWGGVYGGTTTIEDIEKRFAEEVAIKLTGQKKGQSQPTNAHS
jgi:hypothetical protein